MTVTVEESWALFWEAWAASRHGSLEVAAEWMYRLNVFARSIGRHPIAEQIYELKNKFVKYLYQHGYSTEVSLHLKEFDCWGVYDPDLGDNVCDEDCPKCGGTGIFRTEKLYGFRFDIQGKHYAWHQPEKLITYPVQFTKTDPTPFVEPARDAAILSLDDAWTGCCVIWWALLRHGVVADLLIFEKIRLQIKLTFLKWNIFKPIRRRWLPWKPSTSTTRR